MDLPVVMAAPKVKPRDLTLDLRQGVARTTLQRYGQMYQAANIWLLDAGLPSLAALAGGDLAVASEVLTAYLQHMYNEGRPYSHATFTLAAIQYFHRRMWGQLRGAWAAVRTWKMAEPGELRSPIPVLVVWALMTLALSQHGVQLAALLAVTFHALLRPGEACRLTRQDIMLPGDRGWHVQVGMVVIRSPKTARVGGKVQHVILHDPMVLLMCQWAWLGWPTSEKLWSWNLVELSRWFRTSLVQLGLPATRFTPAGLRAGGATYAYLSGSSVEQLMWRGRWETLTSLKHYVQESAATLAIAQLSPDVAARLTALARSLGAVLEALTLTWSGGGECG